MIAERKINDVEGAFDSFSRSFSYGRRPDCETHLKELESAVGWLSMTKVILDKESHFSKVRDIRDKINSFLSNPSTSRKMLQEYGRRVESVRSRLDLILEKNPYNGIARNEQADEGLKKRLREIEREIRELKKKEGDWKQELDEKKRRIGELIRLLREDAGMISQFVQRKEAIMENALDTLNVNLDTLNKLKEFIQDDEREELETLREYVSALFEEAKRNSLSSTLAVTFSSVLKKIGKLADGKGGSGISEEIGKLEREKEQLNAQILSDKRAHEAEAERIRIEAENASPVLKTATKIGSVAADAGAAVFKFVGNMFF